MFLVYLLLITEIQPCTNEINIIQDADLPLLFPQGVSLTSKSQTCDSAISPCPPPSPQTRWAPVPSQAQNKASAKSRGGDQDAPCQAALLSCSRGSGTSNKV